MTITGLPADVREGLSAALRAKGVTQSELAALVGISQALVSRVFAGDRIPSAPVARGLARELNLDDERAALLVTYCDVHASARNLARRWKTTST